MSLDIKQLGNGIVEIEGTKYTEEFFRQLGCSFPTNIGAVLRIDKKDDGVIMLTRLHEHETR